MLIFLTVLSLLLVAVLARRGAALARPVWVEGTAAPLGAPPTSIRVGAYNIAHGRGATDDNFAGGDAHVRAARLDAIAAFIAGLDLDVVVLNEVDFDSIWSGNVDQAKAIADAAGYPVIVRQSNLDVGLGPLGLRFGNAVLSRHPVREVQPLRWPTRSALESAVAGAKSGAVVVVSIGGVDVRVVPVHLEHRDEATRLASVDALLAVAYDGGAPVIALGDFNSGPQGWPLTTPTNGTTALQRALDGGFASAVDVAAPTGLSFPAWAPNRRLDWVLATSPLVVVTDAIVGDEVGLGGASPAPLSDHLAVWATVRVQKQTEASP